MSEEEKPKKDDDKNKLVLKLNADDSALVVRTNGEIELISRELQGKEDSYLGDLEDLNKTFTLVLAFAAALENEQLYNHIFQNLNHVLDKKDLDKRIEDKQEWLNKWREEIERGRAQLEEYMNQHPDERDMTGPFGEMEPPRRKKRKKINPLTKLKNVNWNPYDDTLKANMKSNWREDAPPPEENE